LTDTINTTQTVMAQAVNENLDFSSEDGIHIYTVL